MAVTEVVEVTEVAEVTVTEVALSTALSDLPLPPAVSPTDNPDPPAGAGRRRRR